LEITARPPKRGNPEKRSPKRGDLSKKKKKEGKERASLVRGKKEKFLREGSSPPKLCGKRRESQHTSKEETTKKICTTIQ